MEEVINEIVEFAKKKAFAFGYQDQAQIYGELESRMADLNHDALMNDYLLGVSDDYLLDGM